MNLKTNPELLPLVEWWEKDGKQTVALLAVAAIAVGGWYGWKSHRASVRAAASESLVNAYTADELEEAVSRFSGQAVGGALKIRLAKSYFDAGRYEESLTQYEELLKSPPDGFADIPAVGRAQSLEALGRFAEAAAAFDAFAEKNTKSYLALTAQLGAARAYAEAGDSKKALARIEALKAANKDDEISAARIEATESTIKRHVAKAAKPAEAKPAVAKPIAATPAAQPAGAKPVEAKPIAATPAEAKPAK